MAMGKEARAELIKAYRRSELDTGSCEVQVALMTGRIQELSEHFKRNKFDKHGQRGLLKLVNQRRKLLSYLKRKSPERYTDLIGRLNLRK